VRDHVKVTNRVFSHLFRNYTVLLLRRYRYREYDGHMFITDERVKEFIQIYAEEFGEVLSIAEAREVASNICELYILLLEPLPSELKEMDENAAREAEMNTDVTHSSLTQVLDTR